MGPPYIYVSDFKLNSWRQEGTDDRPGYAFELSNLEQELELTVHYELTDFIRRKWFEIRNVSSRDRLLLDMDVDDFTIPASTSEGDMGLPVFVERELFCAIEHPAGVNQGMNGRLRLRHFPGKKLRPGEVLKSKVAILGVSSPDQGRQQFVDYIQAHSPRKKMLGIYDPLGINGLPDDPCWTLDDEEMLETLKLLEQWRKRGVQFDYYVPDVGWQDWTGDLTQFWPQCFPEGPQKVIKRVNELGMKWGLWFGATLADWSSGLNPKTEPSRATLAGGKWPVYQFRDNYDLMNGNRQLCLASEPYFSILRDALLYHIRHANLRFFKLDCGSYYCNSTSHHHLPGKYSAEANYDAVIEIARQAREASPDIYIMWYWGVRSPFFALHGDSIFENRTKMEAAEAGDYPSLYYRDAVTLATDQGVYLNDLIPPMNKDSLGIWISNVAWGDDMRKERWREALIMDLARGNLLFPQIWGDLKMFNDEDVEFLARIQKIAKQNQALFHNRHTILGDPWKNEVYGYSYFDGSHGFIFMNNMHFQSRRVRLGLDETIGLKTHTDANLRILSHFPDQVEFERDGEGIFKAEQEIETWLRPFEVAMWEVALEEQISISNRAFNKRCLAPRNAKPESHSLLLELEPPASWMEIWFGEPDPSFRSAGPRFSLEELKSAGYQKRILSFRSKLPEFEGPHMLAFVLQFKKNGKRWPCDEPADLVQAGAMIGVEHIIRFETVPNIRQSGTPWIVFRIRTSPAWPSKDVVLAINAYLPPEVDIQCDGWLVPQWWGGVPAV